MKHLSRIAWFCLLSVLGCDGGDPPAGSGGTGSGGAGAGGAGAGGAGGAGGGVSPTPPPVSGDFGWYADIAPAHSFGNGFAVAPNGRVALAFSPIAVGTVAGVPFTHYGPGTKIPNYDILVAVLEATGEVAWWKTFATEEIEGVTALAFDEAGELYLTGLFKDNVDGIDFGGGVSVGIGPGEISSFLVKLSGVDGKALWATAIHSIDTYVQPYCGLQRKEIAVRGGLGAVGCSFGGGDMGMNKVKVETKAGATEITAVASGRNGLLLAFDPASGEPKGSYVFGGAPPLIRSVAITDSGGVVIGGDAIEGTLVDSAGSEPLVLGAPSGFVASLGADFKPLQRRALTGDAASTCSITSVALAGKDRILIGGNAAGNVDLGDGIMGSGPFGFTAALGADLSNMGMPERFEGELVFAIATDAWGQSFVGLSKEEAEASLRYRKHDAAGKVVWESATYVPESMMAFTPITGLGIGVDNGGAPTIFGLLDGSLSIGDSVYGGADYYYFALRFEP